MLPELARAGADCELRDLALDRADAAFLPQLEARLTTCVSRGKGRVRLTL